MKKKSGIKVIEKPLINLSDDQNVSKAELNQLKGGTCLGLDRFMLPYFCVCDKSTFLF